jgi:hypothetical protein
MVFSAQCPLMHCPCLVCVKGQDLEDVVLSEDQQDALTTYFEHSAWVNVLLSLDKDVVRAAQRGRAMKLSAGWDAAYHNTYQVRTPHIFVYLVFMYTYITSMCTKKHTVSYKTPNLYTCRILVHFYVCIYVWRAT